MSKKKRRFACWKCAAPMKKRATFCKKCRKSQPGAVKTQTAMLVKSFGRAVKPVPVAVTKAAAPRCPNPACGAKASLTANCCTRCGQPLGLAGQVRAEKAGQRMQLQIVHSAAWWEREAARQHDPAAREQCRLEARKAEAARGGQADVVAGQWLAKASGARTVREAWKNESDAAARELLRAAMLASGEW